MSTASVFDDRKDAVLASIGISSIEEIAPIEAISDLDFIKQHIVVNNTLREADRQIVYEIIATSGALLKGHFSLLSQKHSEYFIRFSKIARDTKNLRFLADLITKKIKEEKIAVDTVLAPETAASALAVAVAEQLSTYFGRVIETVYAKTDEYKKPTSLINYIDLRPSSNVLLVNDIVTTGRGIRELVRLAERGGGNICGICVFTFRTELKEIEKLEKKYSHFFFSICDSSAFSKYTYDNADVCKICQGSSAKPIPSRYLN